LPLGVAYGGGLRVVVVEDVVVADASPRAMQFAIHGGEFEGGSAVGAGEGPGHLAL